MTFSLAVVDPLHGLLGGACASRSLAVGNAVLTVDPSRGVTISQAATNRKLHGAMLHGLGGAGAPGRGAPGRGVSAGGAGGQSASGLDGGGQGASGLDGGGQCASGLDADVATPEQALASALATDDQPERRQCGVLDLTGRGAAHTGAGTVGWAGHRIGAPALASVQDGIRRPPTLALGNCLAGPEVLDAMCAAVLTPTTGDELARQLVDALLAGDAAGGDIRGKQSAAVLVARIDPEAQWPYTSIVDLRVDDHPDAIAVLADLLDAWIEAGTERRLVGRV